MSSPTQSCSGTWKIEQFWKIVILISYPNHNRVKNSLKEPQNSQKLYTCSTIIKLRFVGSHIDAFKCVSILQGQNYLFF